MEALFIKPPRTLWAFNSELQNTLMPLAIPCLAAVLKQMGVDVKVIDCVPSKIGWKSLRWILERQSIDIVLLSESEPLWGDEMLRIAHLVKRVCPQTKIIAGGIYFSNLVIDIFRNTMVDFIVIGEGERTLAELVSEIQKPRANQNFKKIYGLAYKKDGKVIVTPPRPLIEDIDTLPFPDYDVLPLKLYLKKIPRLRPLITLEHSRGCPNSCTFCSCWPQMGERRLVNGNVQIRPKYRTKSVERTLDELSTLYNKHGCRDVSFADPCWGLYPKWNLQFAEQIIKRKMDIKWFADFRADHIIRDEQKGILKKLVKAGLSHVLIGAESYRDKDLKRFGKQISADTTLKAFKILKEKYPHVVRQASFILDVRDETKASLAEHLAYANKLDTDISVFHPLTPFPGSKIWEEIVKNDELEITDFRQYDWITPVIKMRNLSREDFENFLVMSNKEFLRFNSLKEVLSLERYRRNIATYIAMVASRCFANYLKDFFGLRTELDQQDKYSHYIIPKWYEK